MSMADTARLTQAAAPVQIAASVASAASLILGAAGFVPWVVHDHGDLEFSGLGSTAELLGVFQVSMLHNIIHLAFGVVGLAMALAVYSARNYLIGAGVLYVVLWAFGVLVGEKGSGNFIPVNIADDWLHFVLGGAMLVLGLGMATRDQSAKTH